MGCQSLVILGDPLTFTITTHDPDTGVLTDADSDPIYRVYEDTTAAPILTGTMSLLDAVNTDGFYAEQIACSSGNGFETHKSYNIYIEATVDGDTGGISFAFTVIADITTLIDGTRAEPGQAAPPATATPWAKLDYLYKAWRNRWTVTSTQESLYDDAGAVVDQKRTISDDGTTFTKGEIGTGP